MAQSWEIHFCVLLKDEDFKNAQNIHFEAGLMGPKDLQNFSTMQHFHRFIPRTHHFLQIVQKWKGNVKNWARSNSTFQGI